MVLYKDGKPVDGRHKMKKIKKYRKDYETTQGYALVLAYIGWGIMIFGIIYLSTNTFYRTSDEVKFAYYVLVIFISISMIVTGQMIRALVDNTNANREILWILKAKQKDEGWEEEEEEGENKELNLSNKAQESYWEKEAKRKAEETEAKRKAEETAAKRLEAKKQKEFEEKYPYGLEQKLKSEETEAKTLERIVAENKELGLSNKAQEMYWKYDGIKFNSKEDMEAYIQDKLSRRS